MAARGRDAVCWIQSTMTMFRSTALPIARRLASQRRTLASVPGPGGLVPPGVLQKWYNT